MPKSGLPGNLGNRLLVFLSIGNRGSNLLSVELCYTGLGVGGDGEFVGTVVGLAVESVGSLVGEDVSL